MTTETKPWTDPERSLEERARMLWQYVCGCFNPDHDVDIAAIAEALGSAHEEGYVAGFDAAEATMVPRARADALEEAAEICDHKAAVWDQYDAASDAAELIRELKDKP